VTAVRATISDSGSPTFVATAIRISEGRGLFAGGGGNSLSYAPQLYFCGEVASIPRLLIFFYSADLCGERNGFIAFWQPFASGCSVRGWRSVTLELFFYFDKF